MSSFPVAPKSPIPWSSVMIRMMLGRDSALQVIDATASTMETNGSKIGRGRGMVLDFVRIDGKLVVGKSVVVFLFANADPWSLASQ